MDRLCFLSIHYMVDFQQSAYPGICVCSNSRESHSLANGYSDPLYSSWSEKMQVYRSIPPASIVKNVSIQRERQASVKCTASGLQFHSHLLQDTIIFVLFFTVYVKHHGC